MKTRTNPPCRKKQYLKVSFDFKLSVIDEIANGQISINHAAKKYGISRSSIDYWMRKLANFSNKSNGMSKNDEIKKLREKIEELEFQKDFQQIIIANFEHLTGEELAKKSLPEALYKEIEKKKKALLKRDGSMDASE